MKEALLINTEHYLLINEILFVSYNIHIPEAFWDEPFFFPSTF